jgi:hypothetical protein
MATSYKVLKRLNQININGDNLPKKKITKELNNTEYLIIDNNDFPFTVLLKNNTIYVYRNETYPITDIININRLKKKYKYKYNNGSNYILFCKTKLVKTISKFYNFFIGTDPDDPSYYSNIKVNKQNTGNTFLIGITPKKYWLIYRGIQEYIIKETILEYYSILGDEPDRIPDPIGFTKNKVILFDQQESKSKKDTIVILNKKKIEKLIDTDIDKKNTILNYFYIYNESKESTHSLNKILAVKLNIYNNIFDKIIYGKTIVKYIE